MSTTDQPSDHDIELEQHRGALLISLLGAVNALTNAQRSLAALMSNQIYDIEFAEGATGLDLTAFIDDSLRFTRASARLVSEVTDA